MQNMMQLQVERRIRPLLSVLSRTHEYDDRFTLNAQLWTDSEEELVTRWSFAASALYALTVITSTGLLNVRIWFITFGCIWSGTTAPVFSSMMYEFMDSFCTLWELGGSACSFVLQPRLCGFNLHLQHKCLVGSNVTVWKVWKDSCNW